MFFPVQRFADAVTAGFLQVAMKLRGAAYLHIDEQRENARTGGLRFRRQISRSL